MRLLKQKKFILGLLIVLFLFAPVLVSAAWLVPCGGPNESPCKVDDIFILIARVTNYLVGAAGIYAVYQIVGAGFWMITTSGDEEKLTKYKSALSSAVVGFVFTLLAYIFINTTVNFIFQSKCYVNLSDPLTFLTTCPNRPASLNAPHP